MKKFIIICGLLGTYTSCQKKLEPKEAIIEYYEGGRTMDAKRIRPVVPKMVTDKMIEKYLEYAPFVIKANRQIEWVRDSFINQDTVIVIARYIDNHNQLYKRTFWKEDGNWVCKF
jgi:hypothetical protein